jgi:hypothetical protein
MCFFKRKEEPMTKTEHRFMTFGRNKYGSGNDLNGCVNDSNNFVATMPKAIPDITIHKYLDYDVTVDRYLAKCSEAIALLDPGATVVLLLDSCFSGTATRKHGDVRNRFIGSEVAPAGPVRHVARTELMKWVVISAASEDQTASDAYIGDQYVGAFSYYAYKCLRPGMTWREWYKAIRSYLPNKNFDQIPTIEGPDFLQDRIIGQGQTLIIHNSSHGSWIADKSGDEADGRDEGLYFDKFLSDDKINEMLQKIVL